jgi:hypothetical protein
MRLIDADRKTEELRGKLLMYRNVDQTEEVRIRVRAIRGCIGELREAPTVEGGTVVIEHRAEEVVRCEECRHGESNGQVIYCRHPGGMIRASYGGFCSKGERREGSPLPYGEGGGTG